jgi:hypothetical protein
LDFLDVTFPFSWGVAKLYIPIAMADYHLGSQATDHTRSSLAVETSVFIYG